MYNVQFSPHPDPPLREGDVNGTTNYTNFTN